MPITFTLHHLLCLEKKIKILQRKLASHLIGLLQLDILDISSSLL